MNKCDLQFTIELFEIKVKAITLPNAIIHKTTFTDRANLT